MTKKLDPKWIADLKGRLRNGAHVAVRVWSGCSAWMASIALVRGVIVWGAVTWILVLVGVEYRNLSELETKRPATMVGPVIATHALVKNWRIEAGDVKVASPNWRGRITAPDLSEFVGKYLHVETEVPKDAALGLADLNSAPEIQPTSETTEYWVPLKEQKALVPLMNAGTAVIICDEHDSCGAKRVHSRVAALVCADKTDSDCNAVLYLQADELDSVAKMAAGAGASAGNIHLLVEGR